MDHKFYAIKMIKVSDEKKKIIIQFFIFINVKFTEFTQVLFVNASVVIFLQATCEIII